MNIVSREAAYSYIFFIVAFFDWLPLTEGATVYGSVNGFAYAGKVFLNIKITEAQNKNVQSLQFMGALGVSFRLLRIIVPAAVQLDN